MDARRFLLADIQSMPIEERARTQYDIVLLGSGGGYTCSADDALPEYASAQNPSGVWRDMDSYGCNTATPALPTCDPATGVDELACLMEDGFQPGGDWNQNYQVFGAADALEQLSALGLKSVRIHGRLAYDIDRMVSCGTICMDFNGPGIDLTDGRAIAAWRLSQIVQRGFGNFADPGAPSNMSVKDIECAPQTFPNP